MEQSLDILKSLKQNTIKYFAEYDDITGNILKVGPSHAFLKSKYKVEVESDIALGILKGEIKFDNCYVDVINQKFVFNEERYTVKIDDLLHRITEEKYANHDNPHIFLTYTRKTGILTVQMTEVFYGTKKWPSAYKNEIKRKVHWSGDTVMNFLITAYNDPTILYDTFSIPVNELVGKTYKHKFELLQDKNFSIFTRRILPNYSILIK